MPKRALFVDRDGTIIEDADYLCRVEQVKLLPGAVEALRLAKAAGWFTVLITNQSGVGRGFFPESSVWAVHDHLQTRLGDAALDAIYYCPHAPGDGCICRKPAPGMLQLAARMHDIDLSRSVMIGDKPDDVFAAEATGCIGIKIGKNSDELLKMVRQLTEKQD